MVADTLLDSAKNKSVGETVTSYQANAANTEAWARSACKSHARDQLAKFNTALEKGNIIPPVEVSDKTAFAGMPCFFETPAPEDKRLFTQFDNLAKVAHTPALTDVQKRSIEHLSADDKQMYSATLSELEKLAQGKISPADYMTDTVRTAARLAEKNGRDPGSWNICRPKSQELYCHYVGLAFCDPPLGLTKDAARALAGSAVNIAGITLEQTYQALVKNRAADGFNSNVADVDPSNTITHHYRELMLVGNNWGKLFADFCTRRLDDPKKNTGDDRCGYFAGMLGAALHDGKVTPTEAAELTIWAYTKHGGTQPLWGDSGRAGSFVKPEDYEIDPWLETYRRSL